MTVVPLPESPCVRVRLIYTNSDTSLAGSRFYLSYSNSAPTGANCTTLASDIAASWNTDIAPNIIPQYALTEVDVLDIATDSGFSGQWTGSHSGGNSGTALTANVCINTEFDIERRYRGGKPRMFWPPPTANELQDDSHWTSAFVSGFNTGVGNFFSAIEALSIGAMGTLQHVNLSYYKGFTNITNSSGRERAVPTYRSAALVDNVVGYATKQVVGSQRRRRTATTP